MTDREKLVEIVCNAIQEVDCISHCNHPPCYKVHHVVDELISHGVTVKEPQKPLTVEETAGTNEPVWYEYYKHPIAIPADVVYSHSAPFLEVHKLGSLSVLSMREDAYGKTWRC